MVHDATSAEHSFMYVDQTLWGRRSKSTIFRVLLQAPHWIPLGERLVCYEELRIWPLQGVAAIPPPLGLVKNP